MRYKVPEVTQGDIGRNFHGRATMPPVSPDLPVRYLDLTGAAVFFIATGKKGTKVIEQEANIVGDPVNGEVVYTSKAGDLDTVDLFEQKWEARWTAPVRNISFPDRRNQFRVKKDT